MLEIETVETDDIGKVRQREKGVPAKGVCPDIPHEKTVDNLTVVLQKSFEIKDFAVVESGHHTDTLQDGRIALIVFYGIYYGMQHIGRRTYLLAHGSGTLLEIIVVGIYARYHLRPQAVGKRHLLAATQGIAAGKQDLKM